MTAAAVVSGPGLAPCVVLAVWGTPERRLPGLALAGTLLAVVFLLLAQGLGRSSYVDLALVAAVLGPAGILVFTRCLAGDAERGSLSESGSPRADGGSGAGGTGGPR
jgi:multisubunit Na+/H+ antiporter MnhF subunit